MKEGLLDKIRSWYDGKSVPYENEPGSGFAVIGDRVERSHSARAARVIVEFWLRHWKWCIGTAIAVVGLTLHFAGR